MSDEFYIGWEERAPLGQSRWLRRMIPIIGLAVVALAALLAGFQRPQEPGRFEFGVVREFSGELHGDPVPRLRMTNVTDGSVTNLLLVGAGKFGLPAFARGHEGAQVRFRGSLIEQGALAMIEMNDAESFSVIEPARAGATPPPVNPQGAIELQGELVDTKCYLGVMRPATGKVHRACAVRCLIGGVPPGLLVRDGAGNAFVVLLAGADGGRLDFDVQWAARVLRVRGELELRDQLPVLRVAAMQLAD
jgi:hypothetical protein